MAIIIKKNLLLSLSIVTAMTSCSHSFASEGACGANEQFANSVSNHVAHNACNRLKEELGNAKDILQQEKTQKYSYINPIDPFGDDHDPEGQRYSASLQSASLGKAQQSSKIVKDSLHTEYKNLSKRLDEAFDAYTQLDKIKIPKNPKEKRKQLFTQKKSAKSELEKLIKEGEKYQQTLAMKTAEYQFTENTTKNKGTIAGEFAKNFGGFLADGDNPYSPLASETFGSQDTPDYGDGLGYGHADAEVLQPLQTSNNNYNLAAVGNTGGNSSSGAPVYGEEPPSIAYNPSTQAPTTQPGVTNVPTDTSSEVQRESTNLDAPSNLVSTASAGTTPNSSAGNKPNQEPQVPAAAKETQKQNPETTANTDFISPEDRQPQPQLTTAQLAKEIKQQQIDHGSGASRAAPDFSEITGGPTASDDTAAADAGNLGDPNPQELGSLADSPTTNAETTTTTTTTTEANTNNSAVASTTATNEEEKSTTPPAEQTNIAELNSVTNPEKPKMPAEGRGFADIANLLPQEEARSLSSEATAEPMPATVEELENTITVHTKKCNAYAQDLMAELNELTLEVKATKDTPKANKKALVNSAGIAKQLTLSQK